MYHSLAAFGTSLACGFEKGRTRHAGRGLPLTEKGLIEKRRGQSAMNTLTPGAGDFRASPPVYVKYTFPDGKTPNGMATVGGRFLSIGTASSHELVNELADQTNKSAKAAFIASQNKRFAHLFLTTASFTPPSTSH
jgi:hypothetical protein